MSFSETLRDTEISFADKVFSSSSEIMYRRIVLYRSSGVGGSLILFLICLYYNAVYLSGQRESYPGRCPGTGTVMLSGTGKKGHAGFGEGEGAPRVIKSSSRALVTRYRSPARETFFRFYCKASGLKSPLSPAIRSGKLGYLLIGVVRTFVVNFQCLFLSCVVHGDREDGVTHGDGLS
jgi:hypothetical protein